MPHTLLSLTESSLGIGEQPIPFEAVAQSGGNDRACNLEENGHQADASVVIHVSRIVLLVEGD